MKSNKKIVRALKKKNQQRAVSKRKKMRDGKEVKEAVPEKENDDQLWDDMYSNADSTMNNNTLKVEGKSKKVKPLSRKQSLRKQRGREKGENLALRVAEKLKDKVSRRKDRHKNRSETWD
eukprot:PhM_4_TR7056/c0_g1_i1/m.37477